MYGYLNYLNSFGYAVQLFYLFKNDYQFCIIESKNIECILFGEKNN